MSLMPWNVQAMMSPYYADPYYVEPLEWDVAPSLRSMMRPMRRMERQMDREVGKLLISVKEDDKSFQVTIIEFCSRLLPQFLL